MVELYLAFRSESSTNLLIMEVINANAVTMTNFEVMTFLQEQKDLLKEQKGKKKEKKKRMNKSLLTVTLETLSWMESSPSSVQTEENIQDFCQKLAEFCSENKNPEGGKLRLEILAGNRKP